MKASPFHFQPTQIQFFMGRMVHTIVATRIEILFKDSKTATFFLNGGINAYHVTATEFKSILSQVK